MNITGKVQKNPDGTVKMRQVRPGKVVPLVKYYGIDDYSANRINEEEKRNTISEDKWNSLSKKEKIKLRGE